MALIRGFEPQIRDVRSIGYDWLIQLLHGIGIRCSYVSHSQSFFVTICIRNQALVGKMLSNTGGPCT